MLLAGGRHRRPRDVSRARPSARDAGCAGGVSRPRSCSRSWRATRAARRRIRARAATGAFASRSCSRSRGAPGLRAWRPGTTRGSSSTAAGSLLARAVDEQKDQSYMLARLDPRHLERIWFPLGEQTKDETRAEAERAGLAVAARGGEPGGVLPGRRRLPRLPRAARAGRPRGRASWTKRGRRSARTRASGVSRRASGEGSASRPGVPRTRSRSDPATNTVVVGPRGLSLARREVTAAGRLFASVTRGDAKLRYRSPAVAGRRRGDGRRDSVCRLDEPAYGVASGQTAVLYEGDVVVGAGRSPRRR